MYSMYPHPASQETTGFARGGMRNILASAGCHLMSVGFHRHREMAYRLSTALCALFFILCACGCSAMSTSSALYRQAKEDARSKNYDRAFLKARSILQENPRSSYAPIAAFAVGEYFLLQNDYPDATLAFYNYIRNYPKDAGVIFAELIINKISDEIKSNRNISFQELDLIEGIRKKIFSKPLFFLFFEKTKSFSYRSLFGNFYIAYDYVDRVTVMRNGELFCEISF